MQTNLSEKELKRNLILLRDILKTYNHSSFSNIIFFNAESFYSFMDRHFKRNDKSIKTIMESLEPYIPLTLSVDNSTAELFLIAITSNDQKELKELERRFYTKAVFEFINIVKKIKTEKEMDYIFELCNNLRLMQES